MSLSIVFYVQKLRHYILLSRTQVMVNSIPMWYLLSCHLVQGHAAKWIFILHKYDLEFVAPKRIKALALA